MLKVCFLLISVKSSDDVMGREDSFSDIHGNRQTEGGRDFLGTKYYHWVNISGRTALALTLGWNGRSQLFCGPLWGWPQEAAVCWTSSGLVCFISHASATSPNTHPFLERSWDSSDEHGKQTVLHSRSAQRSFTGSCGYLAHHSWRQSIKMHFLEFKHKGKSKAVPLQAWTGPQGSMRLRPPDFLTSSHEGGRCLKHRPPLPPGLTWYSFSEAESTPGYMELSDATEKAPATPGIDPGTFRLVAQCLNHYATPFTKSEYSFPLSFWMPSLNSRMHFLEFTHAEPKYTCVFPSRSQWAFAALNNSCINDS
jgi:hypothetical protein